jgi:hypothetical protein
LKNSSHTTAFAWFAVGLLSVALAACKKAEEPAKQPAPAPAVTQVPVPKEGEERPKPPLKQELPPLFRDIERRTFQFFWDTSNEVNGLTPDRFPSRPFASIASVGFALTAYPIGIENGWVSRTQAVDRTLTTLKFFRQLPQGPQREGKGGYHGFYYHFLDMQKGHRYASWVELSSVDTGLLMMGVLFAQSYYDRDDPREKEIRELAEQLYRRVEWPWLQVNKPLISMGWFPESGFIPHDWMGYNEAMLLYILALGSPTYPVSPDAWQVWTRTYNDFWGVYQGQEYLTFGPHFGHQYSHVWIDFRGIQDDYMRERGIDYFENSRRATYAQRNYAIENPMKWKDYGENVWGLTASDGPQQTLQDYEGEQRTFRHYSARGAGFRENFDAVCTRDRHSRDRGDAQSLWRIPVFQLWIPGFVQPQLQLRYSVEDGTSGARQRLGIQRLHRHRPRPDPGDDHQLPQRVRLERDEGKPAYPTRPGEGRLPGRLADAGWRTGGTATGGSGGGGGEGAGFGRVAR